MVYGGHIRETGPDLGLVMKWNLNEEGLLIGCGIDPRTLGKGMKDPITIAGMLGIMNCEKQDLRENNGRGRTLYDRVMMYAKETRRWYRDYVPAFKTVQSNGYKSGELREGPNNFWSHHCCFEAGVNWDMKGDKAPYNIPYPKVTDPLECQKLCYQDKKCKYFR